MPQMQIKTVKSDEVWSKNGKTIYKVIVEVDGKQFTAKTYSDAISKTGWQGTVETYEKQGIRGAETFLKQPQKEYSGGGSTNTSHKSVQSDPFTMFLSYAKDIAVAMLDKNGKLDIAYYGEVLDAVSMGGKTLYESRPDAPDKTTTTEQTSSVISSAKNDLSILEKELDIILPVDNTEEQAWIPQDENQTPLL